ncbi:hypothetical protein HDU87_004009 [Geranomyces variabilis]|uniref:Uncharacterized protein n=1 Tax=Geranomyces variabilis TaxID=109894 RepID=A0AAD5TQU4_9FUNG|nr:hypothetical protein HDU87_004009 [Geranomyces variabilis]
MLNSSRTTTTAAATRLSTCIRRRAREVRCPFAARAQTARHASSFAANGLRSGSGGRSVKRRSQPAEVLPPVLTAEHIGTDPHGGPVRLVQRKNDWNISTSPVERQVTAEQWADSLAAPAPTSNANFMANEGLAAKVATLPTSELIGWVSDKKNRLRDVDADTVNVLFTELCKRGATRALQLQDWHRLLQNLVGRTPFSHPSPSHDRQRGIQALKEMKRCSVEPDGFVYACLLRAVKDDVKEVEAVHAYTKKKQKTLSGTARSVYNDKVCRTLLAVYLRRAKGSPMVARAHAVWQDMRDFVIVPSVDTYCGLLEAFSATGSGVQADLQTVVKISGFMKLNAPNRTLDPVSIHALILAHSACGHHKAVLKLADEMRERKLPLGFSHHKAIMKAHVNGFSPMSAVREFVSMQSQGIGPDDECCELALRSFAASRNPGGVAKIHRLILSAVAHRSNPNDEATGATPGGVITARSYLALIEAYRALNDARGAIAAYMELKAYLLDSHVDGGESKPLRQSQHPVPWPSRAAVTHVAATLAAAGDAARARAFLLTEALEPVRLEALWSRAHSGTEKRARVAREKLEIQLADAREEARGAYSERRKHIKARVPILEKRLAKMKAGTERASAQILVGRDGVLKVIYEGFAQAWRDMVDRLGLEFQAAKALEGDGILLDTFEKEGELFRAWASKLGLEGSAEQPRNENEVSGNEQEPDAGDVDDRPSHPDNIAAGSSAESASSSGTAAQISKPLSSLS